MRRIALVDDDRNLLISLRMALEAEGFAVETHADGRTALEAFSRRCPELAVLDVRMPRLDGLELLRRVRQSATMPVILLSALGEEVDEMLGLRLGADDYLRKPISPRLLAERVRAALRRASPMEEGPVAPPSDVLDRGLLSLDLARYLVTWRGHEVALTATEFSLLRALAERPGTVKTRDQLMDVAYADRVYVDDRAIDSHIKRVRRKMRRADPGFASIETLYGLGYRFRIE